MTNLTLEESLIMFMDEIAKRHDENSNLIKEIQASTDFALRNQKASIKALEIQVKQMSIILHEKLSGNLQSSIEIKPRVNDETISTSVETDMPSIRLGDLIPTKLIVELVDRTVKRPKGIVENVLVGRPFLSTAHAIINVLIKIMELDLEARLIGNVLRKNVSHDFKFEDYIELSDLNEPLELGHDQVVDLGPAIKEGEVIDTTIKEIVKTRNDDDKITIGIEDYPSFSNFDRKIHVNNAYNLRFFCMIGYEHVDANFFALLSINMMSKRFYNSIMKDKLEFKGKSVVGAFMIAPMFVGTFSVVTDFAVIEDMDHYRDEEMDDVIVKKEFCKEIGVKAK
ncbi:hypothetical protein Tco_1504764 [Tanacetum coccineum]